MVCFGYAASWEALWDKAMTRDDEAKALLALLALATALWLVAWVVAGPAADPGEPDPVRDGTGLTSTPPDQR
jgi:hypothetical protein